MKSLNTYINEWRFNKDTECVLLKPEKIEDLRMIIMNQLKLNNKKPNMSVVDVSNMKSLADSFSTWSDNDGIIDYYGVDMEKIEYIDLSNWDISKVKDLTSMFFGLVNVKEIDLSGWNTSNVTTMNGMFIGCKNLKEIKGIEDWDVSKVIDMEDMFYECESLELPSWYNKSK